MAEPSLRRLWASLFLAAALAPSQVPAGEAVGRSLAGADYAQVRQALVEAIEGEGLVPGPVSPFGAMLERTDADLHHGGNLYAEAEVFSFCSVAVAARMVREDPDRIADCPLTIALYRLKGSREVRLVYRPREGDTPAARAANQLLERIVGRTREAF